MESVLFLLLLALFGFWLGLMVDVADAEGGGGVEAAKRGLPFWVAVEARR